MRRGVAHAQRHDFNIDPGGFANGQNFIAHFGLGDATSVDVLRIEWTSGIVQELQNVPVKQYLTMTEPTRLEAAIPGTIGIRGWKGMVFSIEASNDLETWATVAVATNLTGKLQWTYAEAGRYVSRFYRAVKR